MNGPERRDFLSTSLVRNLAYPSVWEFVNWIGVDETRNAELLCIERSSVTGDAKANLEDWNKKGNELKTKMAPNALSHACMDSAGVLICLH